MKKKIAVLCSVFVIVFGIFIFKNFYMNKNNKDDSNENSKNNAITENKSNNNNNKNDSSNDNKNSSDSKNSNSDENLTLESLKSQKKVMILDFSQNGWHACAVQHPVLEKLKKEYKDKVIIKTIDLRKQQAFASQFPVRVTPTLFYFNADGTPYEAKGDLAKKISYVAYEDKKTGELKFGGSEGVVKYEELKQVIEEMLKNVK